MPDLKQWKIKVKTDQHKIEVGNIVVDVVPIVSPF